MLARETAVDERPGRIGRSQIWHNLRKHASLVSHILYHITSLYCFGGSKKIAESPVALKHAKGAAMCPKRQIWWSLASDLALACHGSHYIVGPHSYEGWERTVPWRAAQRFPWPLSAGCASSRVRASGARSDSPPTEPTALDWPAAERRQIRIRQCAHME